MIAVLDACVVYPPALRDVLMWLAVVAVYEPRWTEEIHVEWMRNVLEDRPDVTPAQLERTRPTPCSSPYRYPGAEPSPSIQVGSIAYRIRRDRGGLILKRFMLLALVCLTSLGFGQESRPRQDQRSPKDPSAVQIRSSLKNLPGFNSLGWLAQPPTFKVDPYIRMAVMLQAAGQVRGHESLEWFATTANPINASTYILCRMLFSAGKKGFGMPDMTRTREGWYDSYLGKKGFQAPHMAIGRYEVLGGTNDRDWQLFPIALVDGIPFLVIRPALLQNRTTGPEPEPIDYLNYCLHACNWNVYQYRIPTAEEKRRALDKLLMSSSWRRALTADEKAYLANQIE